MEYNNGPYTTAVSSNSSYYNANGAVYTTMTSPPTGNNRDQLKRNLHLDLDKSSGVIKRSRTGLTPAGMPINPNNRLEILQSPDLQLLKLGSPEIERLIMQQNITILSTPTSASGGQGVFYPKNINEEQEVYVKGFQDALSRLQHNNNGEHQGQISLAYHPSFNNAAEESNDWGRRSDDAENHSSSEAGGYDTDDNSMTSGAGSMMSYSSNGLKGHANNPYGHVIIKEEPSDSQIVPTMSEMNPIDMASQERIKLERKRQRNRVAASKCRKRKLERIAKLEEKVKQIKNENAELNAVADRLRDSVARLRAEIASHRSMGCTFSVNNYSL